LNFEKMYSKPPPVAPDGDCVKEFIWLCSLKRRRLPRPCGVLLFLDRVRYYP
jgi:hypothetical protein